MPADWTGVQCFIQVQRQFISAQGTSQETAYFISSLPDSTSAQEFADGIRGHWHIENCLHYPKDVTMREDASKVRTKNAPQNTSLVKNIALNIIRQQGYTNIAQAIRLLAGDIPKLWKFVSA